MKKVLWSLLAVLPLLGVGAWQGAAHLTAGASPAGQQFDCCLDPAGTRRVAAGCSLECPPDCLDFTTAQKAEKGACCPQSKCCPSGACRAEAATATDAPKTSVKKKITCPECPFCPEW